MHLHIIHCDPALANWNPVLTPTQPMSWSQRLYSLNIRKRLTGLTCRNCTTSIKRHWQSTTPTAPCQCLHHTHPRSAAYATYATQIYKPTVHSGRRRSARVRPRPGRVRVRRECPGLGQLDSGGWDGGIRRRGWLCERSDKLIDLR